MSDVARAAGVSKMAVSLALRNSPELSKATRDRIQATARKLGYRPDPQLSRLMVHLRSSRGAVVHSSLAIVDFSDRAANEPESLYNRRVRAGAKSAAEQSGYALSSFNAREYASNLARLLDVIRKRGIEGVIILPNDRQFSLPQSLDWTSLSVVAATSSLVEPRFHRVLPDQFGNMVMLLESLRHRGFRRIGAVFQRNYDERTAHTISAAMSWAGHGRRVCLTEGAGSPDFLRDVVPWYRRHGPEVVIAHHPSATMEVLTSRLKLDVPRDVGVVGMGVLEDPRIDLLDERPELVGEAAVATVAGMIYRGENGIPHSPRRTLIEGAFVARGSTLPSANERGEIRAARRAKS